LKADTFCVRFDSVKSRNLSTARQTLNFNTQRLASVESRHQIPYCGPVPLVPLHQPTQVSHMAASHVIFHKATRLSHGAATLKPAQQSSNGARTGPKVPPDDTVTDCRGCGHHPKMPQLAMRPGIASPKHSRAQKQDAKTQRARFPLTLSDTRRHRAKPRRCRGYVDAVQGRQTRIPRRG
jgi:hypothetical protein